MKKINPSTRFYQLSYGDILGTIDGLNQQGETLRKHDLKDIQAMTTKIVRITVEGGVINVWRKPKGITVITRDYDCLGDCLPDDSGEYRLVLDKDGNHYHEEVLK